MAQITITQLPLAGPLTGSESVPIVQNGVTVQSTTGAIAGAGALNFPFLTVGTAAGLSQGRYLATGSGLQLVDNGVGNSLQINLTGAAQSLNGAGNGFMVKTGANTLINRLLTVGGGMTIVNADGIAGNPLIGLNANLQALASLSGIGLMTINGSTFSQTTLLGTTNSITISNGNASSGNPTIAISNNPVLTGTGGVQVPTGTTAQRLANNGVIRYNSDTSRFEFYQGGTWTNIGIGDGTVTYINGTTNQISVANPSTTPTISISSNPVLPGTAFVILPQGSTAQRGTPSYGALRYNTDTGGLEAYTQVTGWGAIISGAGVSTFTAGSTGLTPSSPMSGGIVLGGVLNPASGGTGVNNGGYTTTLAGNLSFAGSFSTAGAYALTLTTIGATSVTLPTTGTLATLSGVETLTNKSMSGLSNTFTNIPNSSLTNSSVTYNGVTVALGASGTITSNTTNTLTIGTGLSGTSFNGSAPVTIAIDSTVATLTGVQTLTNKTISGANNTLSNIGNSSLTNSSVTFNGQTVALGGSGTITAVNTYTLTFGTHLTGTSYNGSAAVTIGTDATNANTVSTIVARDASGNFSAGTITATLNGTATQVSNALTFGSSLSGTSSTYNGSAAVTLNVANSGVTAGTYGSSAVIPVITVGADGRVTSVSNQSTNAPAYQGTWNANTNTPTLTSSVGTAGYYYVVTTAGNTTLNGVSGWNIGDWAIFSNGAWQKIPGSTTESFTNLITTNLQVGGLTGFVYANNTTGYATAATTAQLLSLLGTTPVANGGTGLTSLTAGSLVYGAGTSAFNTLAIGTNGQILTSNGTAPVWSTLSGVAVTTFSGGTTGLTPATATSGAITLGGTLAIANGGTGQTSFTAGYVHYGSFSTSANLQFDGTNLGIGVAPVSSKGQLQVGNISYTDTGILAGFASSVAGYNQIILQNTNSGATASTNFNVSNNNGTSTTNFGEFGINSSGFTGSGAFSTAGNVYLASASTDLAIGTYGSNAIHFVVNSGATDAMTIPASGPIVVPVGIAGGAF
jgi:hypothetical protein